MHSCAALLSNRKLNNPDSKFGPNETKLMYTLHWSILDAASECEDLETEKSNGNLFGKSVYSSLHSLDTIQLFVYLFGPLVHTLRESDFQSLKLENGLRLWQPLWEYQQPDVPCFSTPVKPKRNVLKAQRNLMKVNTNAANIYVGNGNSTENLFMSCLDDAPPSRASTAYNESSVAAQAPLARMSDICAVSVSESQSATVEVICEICHKVLYSRNTESLCQCDNRRVSIVSTQDQKPVLVSPVDKEYVNKRLESAINSGTRGNVDTLDLMCASYFDVAVLRCLFSPQWAEEGIYWALRYIHQRLLEMKDEIHRVEYCRERSKSLPVPEIHITPVLTPGESTAESPDEKKITESATLSADTTHLKRDSITSVPKSGLPETKRESGKRMRMSDFRHMIGDKVKGLRRRESVEQFELEKMHQEEREREKLASQFVPSVSVQEIHPPRPSSALAKLAENAEDAPLDAKTIENTKCTLTSTSPVIDIVRRKSMPTLMREGRGVTDETIPKQESNHRDPSLRKDSVTRAFSLKPELLHKPIITITKDSPSPTPATSDWSIKKESDGSEKSTSSTRPISLSRSMTDSNIQYDQHEELQEAPGAAYYIQENGHLNYDVILQAVHYISSKECSSRVSSVILNILNCLLDLEVIEKKEPVQKQKESEESCKDGKEPVEKDVEKKKEEPPPHPFVSSLDDKPTAYQVAMESIIK